MTSNPAKAADDGAMSAEEILGLARDGVSADLLGCLMNSDRTVLARYAWRQVTAAFRQGSVPLLRDALLAFSICQAARDDGIDDRDVMVALAVFHFVAQELGESPAELFGDVASQLPDGPVPDLLRVFGARRDITLKAFGWLLVQTPDGPDFKPAPPPWATKRTDDSR